MRLACAAWDATSKKNNRCIKDSGLPGLVYSISWFNRGCCFKLLSPQRVDCIFTPLNYSLPWPQMTERKCLLALWRHRASQIAAKRDDFPLNWHHSTINQLCLCVQFISQSNFRGCRVIVRDLYVPGSILSCNSAAGEQLPVNMERKREGRVGQGDLSMTGRLTLP